MVDPVIISDGHSYERHVIVKWAVERANSPLTREPVDLTVLLPNIALKKAIDWFFDHPPEGFTVAVAHRMRSEIGKSHALDKSTSYIEVPDHSPVSCMGMGLALANDTVSYDFRSPTIPPTSRMAGQTPDSQRRPRRRPRDSSHPAAARRLGWSAPDSPGDAVVRTLRNDTDDEDLMKGIAASLLTCQPVDVDDTTPCVVPCMYNRGMNFDSEQVSICVMVVFFCTCCLFATW